MAASKSMAAGAAAWLLSACANMPTGPSPELPAALEPITCRPILAAPSNVIVTKCATTAQWRAFDDASARAAQALVQRLQGSPYQRETF